MQPEVNQKTSHGVPVYVLDFFFFFLQIPDWLVVFCEANLEANRGKMSGSKPDERWRDNIIYSLFGQPASTPPN